MRVNARLDELTYQQLEYLRQTTGQSVSHVVRESVAQYYVQVKQQQRAPSRFLAMAGTGHSGLGDVSSNVKQYVAEALAQKYPQHRGAQAEGKQGEGVQPVLAPAMGAKPAPKQRKTRAA